MWGIFYFILGLIFTFYGFLTDAPGTWYLAAIYVAFPVVYLTFVSGITSFELIRKIESAIVVAGIAFSFYVIIYAAWALKRFPDSLFFKLDAQQNIGIAHGWIQMRLYAISGLVFFIPYVVAALCVFPNSALPVVRRRGLWVGLFVGFVAAVLSGRKALLIAITISPVLALVFRQFLPESVRRGSTRRVWGVMAILAVAVVGGGGFLQATGRFDFSQIFDVIAAGFKFSNDADANERSKQFLALLGEWAERPLFGWGWGQGARAISRSARPWEYELQYVLLLFSTGLIGAIAYISGVVWIFVTGLRLIRSGEKGADHMVPFLVGLACILLANATNPYLPAFGNLWMLFLPISLINYWLLRRERIGFAGSLHYSGSIMSRVAR
jgi:O-antigen ligase